MDPPKNTDVFLATMAQAKIQSEKSIKTGCSTSASSELWVDKKRGMAKCENQRDKSGIEQRVFSQCRFIVT
jgi:hypothetical protein